MTEQALLVLTQFISDHNGYIPKHHNELVGYSCERYDLPTLDDIEARQIIYQYRQSLAKVRKHRIQREDVRGQIGKIKRWWSNSKGSKTSNSTHSKDNHSRKELKIRHPHTSHKKLKIAQRDRNHKHNHKRNHDHNRHHRRIAHRRANNGKGINGKLSHHIDDHQYRHQHQHQMKNGRNGEYDVDDVDEMEQIMETKKETIDEEDDEEDDLDDDDDDVIGLQLNANGNSEHNYEFVDDLYDNYIGNDLERARKKKTVSSPTESKSKSSSTQPEGDKTKRPWFNGVNIKSYIFILICFVCFMIISASFIGAIYSNTENAIIWRQYSISEFNRICDNSYDKFLKTKNYDPGKTFEAMIIINLLHVTVLWMITTLLSLYIYYYSYLKDKELNEYCPSIFSCCFSCCNGCCLYVGPIFTYFTLWLINIILTHSVLSDINNIQSHCDVDSKLFQVIARTQAPFCLYHLIVLYVQVAAIPAILTIIVLYISNHPHN